MFGNVLNVGKFQNTSQTWKVMWKQIISRVCNLIAASALKYSNQGEVYETTLATFIRRNMASPLFLSFDSSLFLAVFEQIKTFMGTAFDEEGKKVVVCTFCGHKSKYATNIRSHIEGKHTEGLVYKCLFCDYSVNTWQTVLQHMRRTHNYQTSFQQPLNSVHSQM